MLIQKCTQLIIIIIIISTYIYCYTQHFNTLKDEVTIDSGKEFRMFTVLGKNEYKNTLVRLCVVSGN